MRAVMAIVGTAATIGFDAARPDVAGGGPAAQVPATPITNGAGQAVVNIGC